MLKRCIYLLLTYFYPPLGGCRPAQAPGRKSGHSSPMHRILCLGCSVSTTVNVVSKMHRIICRQYSAQAGGYV